MTNNDDQEHIPSVSSKNILNVLYQFETSDEMVKKLEDATLIWGKFLYQGHFCVICSAPNAGKSTLARKIAADLSRHGFDVAYINVDASGSDIKAHHEEAKHYGYRVIAPDLHVGSSVVDVTKGLEELAKSGADFSQLVLILDTLKKFVDVIQKSQSKKFYATLRSLTTKGATVLVLSHTNKYSDSEGKPVFEGTADLRADVDELVYLVSTKTADDSDLLISATIDKRKSDAEKMSFRMAAQTREIEILNDFVDAGKIIVNQKQLWKDQPVIDWLKTNLLNAIGSKTMTELQNEALAAQIATKSHTREVLFRYSDESGAIRPIFTRSRGQTQGYRFGLMTQKRVDEVWNSVI